MKRFLNTRVQTDWTGLSLVEPQRTAVPLSFPPSRCTLSASLALVPMGNRPPTESTLCLTLRSHTPEVKCPRHSASQGHCHNFKGVCSLRLGGGRLVQMWCETAGERAVCSPCSSRGTDCMLWKQQRSGIASVLRVIPQVSTSGASLRCEQQGGWKRRCQQPRDVTRRCRRRWPRNRTRVEVRKQHQQRRAAVYVAVCVCEEGHRNWVELSFNHERRRRRRRKMKMKAGGRWERGGAGVSIEPITALCGSVDEK